MFRSGQEVYSTKAIVSCRYLSAFSGSPAVLQEHFRCKMLSGLHAVELDLALLSFPTEPLFRRELIRGECKTSFPSWSWASWEGSVTRTMDLVLRRDKTVRPTPNVYMFALFNKSILCTGHQRSSTEGKCIKTTTHGIDSLNLDLDVLHF